MPDSKITALTSISTSTDPANDPLVIVDVSDTSMAATGTTKKVTLNQLLGASGTATLASATITGDLTVDTNTLYVNSTSNNVGLGTLTPSGASGRALEIYGGAGQSRIVLKNDTTGSASTDGSQIALVGSQLVIQNREASEITFETNNSERYRLDSTGVATWSNVGGVAGTAMTLNATGLGVGTSSHTVKLGVVDTVNTFAATFRGNVGTDFVAIGTTALGASINAFTAGFGAATNLILQPNGGNVGIGVTPSAWGGGLKALQVNGGASLAGDLANSYLNANAFYNGTSWIYSTTNGASRMALTTSGLQWYTAPSGTAGTAIGSGFTTAAMTLDASGNLLVGTTDTSSTSGAGFKIIGSGLGPYVVNAASTNAALAYTMYSTGAAAYRFYVGWGGTVFATNTTISAISDARLKENVQDIDVGLGAILALKPRKFDWKAGKGKDIKGDRGFIAQEFEQVFPQLVDEWKDAAPEGEAPYKSVRQDLIPVLVKAIQELTARVQTLETR